MNGFINESVDHDVRFFRDKKDLIETICDFLLVGLELGEPCVLAAERFTAGEVQRQLTVRGYGREISRISVLDAVELADEVAPGGAFRRSIFQRHIAPAIGAGAKQSITGRVRVYNEIVDVLRRSNRHLEALELECLWREAAKTIPLRLMCGYRADPLELGTWSTAECHEAIAYMPEIFAQRRRIERAITSVLGSQTGMLRVLVAAEPRLRTLPFAQAALFWIGSHLPAIAAKLSALLEGSSRPSAGSSSPLQVIPA